MKEIANAAFGLAINTAETAEEDALRQPVECPVGKPELLIAAPGDSTSTGTVTWQAVHEEALPSIQPVSVVAKVAKLLTSHCQYLRLEHPIHWKKGYLHQKVLLSLRANREP